MRALLCYNQPNKRQREGWLIEELGQFNFGEKVRSKEGGLKYEER